MIPMVDAPTAHGNPGTAPTEDVSPLASPAPKRPRDSQRRRVYLAETPQPPGHRYRDLMDCIAFAEQVVGSLWWMARFPARDLGRLPRFRPGYGARQAFFHVDEFGPAITLPRRYRTASVILHELVHWAQWDDHIAPHGPEFCRVYLDAVTEFLGSERGQRLADAFAEQRVKVAPAS